jgi:hypothetical protein
MFGLFGKSDFDKEMLKIDAQIKIAGKELIMQMNQCNIRGTASIMAEMNNLYQKQIDLCNQHGRLDKIKPLKELQAKIKALVG